MRSGGSLANEPATECDLRTLRAQAQRFIDAVAKERLPWLSVVIPAFDESRRIAPTLLSIVLWLRNRGHPFEVIVVDDGSRDETGAVVDEFSVEHPEVRVIRFDRNRGKGAAVREGMRIAAGSWRLMADADGATPIPELDRLLVEASKGADVVIGSRAIAASDTIIERRLARHLIGRLFAALVHAVAVPGVRDTQCGFKLFRGDVARELFAAQRLERFGFDVELLFLARRLGWRVAEVAVSWNDVQGSKVSLASGLDAFLDVLRVRWIHRGGR